MQTCTKCAQQSPDTATNCINCQADLSEWSERAVAYQRFMENSRVRYVRIVVYDDCCPACGEMKGAYTKEDVPSLPTEGCSHKYGCRCFYQPFLEEIYP